jgi:hypothetical protein
MSVLVRTLLVAAAAGGTLLACLLWTPLSSRADRRISPIPDRAGLATAELMARKVSGSNRVLNGLVIADFDMLLRSARDLRDVSEQPGWGVTEVDPAYRHFHLEFQRLSLKLIRMSESRNIEGAAYTFQNLTATCIACHQHVRDVVKVGDAGEAASE